MARAPGMDKSELDPTHVQCFDCDDLYPFEGAAECPEEPEDHGFELVHVTDTPLGYEDDDDYLHRGRKQYEYPARED